MTAAIPGRRPGLGFGTSWAALAIVLVLISAVGPAGSQFVRRTLVLVLIYLVLTHTEQVSSLIDDLIAGLKGATP
jgi:hypothetical protein